MGSEFIRSAGAGDRSRPLPHHHPPKQVPDKPSWSTAARLAMVPAGNGRKVRRGPRGRERPIGGQRGNLPVFSNGRFGRPAGEAATFMPASGPNWHPAGITGGSCERRAAGPVRHALRPWKAKAAPFSGRATHPSNVPVAQNHRHGARSSSARLLTRWTLRFAGS